MDNLLAPTKALLVLATSVLAYQYPPIPQDLTTPVQQRIAINSPNAVSIGWNTYGPLSQICVQYGTSATALSSETCSSSPSTTYPTSRTYSNSVTLTGLTPATTYYYKIVSTNSSVDHFMSPRTPGDQTPFNLSSVVDLGVYGTDGYTSTKKRDSRPLVDPALNHTTIGCLADTVDSYEFVIHPGDFAYADDWAFDPSNTADSKDAYQSILENFYDQLAPIAARKPYMASPGNHEADCQEADYTSGLCPQGQYNFTDFMHRFDEIMPTAFPSSSSDTTAQQQAQKAQSLALPPFWYSFEYGMAHITMIDTETDFTNAPDGPGGSAGLNGGPFGAPNQQLDFLAADLASVDRTVTPWLIVAGHRPWYTAGTKGCAPCQQAFEPLFYKYGVDLGVFGHVHNSQRFYPVNNSVADPNGMNDPAAPMYIIAGGAGNIEGLDVLGAEPSYEAWAYSNDWAYATLNFLDTQHLQVTFVQSSTGDILDSSVLFKNHSAQFVVQS